MGGYVWILGAAGVEQLVVSFAGHVQIAGEDQVQPRVAVAIIVQGF